MSGFIDKQGRIFGKVNVVDIVIVLGLIALLAFAVDRMHHTSPASVSVRVTFRVQQVRKATVDKLRLAYGTVKDDSGRVLGTVEKVVAQPSEEEVLSPLTGKLEVQESPLFEDVDITVLAKTIASNGSYRIGSVSIPVGKKLVLSGTPSFQASATVQSLQPQ